MTLDDLAIQHTYVRVELQIFFICFVDPGSPDLLWQQHQTMGDAIHAPRMIQDSSQVHCCCRLTSKAREGGRRGIGDGSAFYRIHQDPWPLKQDMAKTRRLRSSDHPRLNITRRKIHTPSIQKRCHLTPWILVLPPLIIGSDAKKNRASIGQYIRTHCWFLSKKKKESVSQYEYHFPFLEGFLNYGYPLVN